MILDRLDPETKLFGISCMFMHHWPVVRELIVQLREHFPGVPVIVGGEQVSGGAQYCLQESDMDAVVKGEGDETVVPLVEALLEGRPLEEVDGIAY